MESLARTGTIEQRLSSVEGLALWWKRGKLNRFQISEFSTGKCLMVLENQPIFPISPETEAITRGPKNDPDSRERPDRVRPIEKGDRRTDQLEFHLVLCGVSWREGMGMRKFGQVIVGARKSAGWTQKAATRTYPPPSETRDRSGEVIGF
jgi:hypothetical protein